MAKETALQKFFKTHRRTCAVHNYSGKRHCSCGRDEALKEIENLQKVIRDITDKMRVNERE